MSVHTHPLSHLREMDGAFLPPPPPRLVGKGREAPSSNSCPGKQAVKGAEHSWLLAHQLARLSPSIRLPTSGTAQLAGYSGRQPWHFSILSRKKRRRPRGWRPRRCPAALPGQGGRASGPPLSPSASGTVHITPLLFLHIPT